MVFLLPDLAHTLRSVAAKGRLVSWFDHLRQAVRNEGRAWIAKVLEIACLPYEACLNLDAVVMSVWRLWVTRRGLLIWRPAAGVGCVSDGSVPGTLMATGAVPLLVSGLACLAGMAGGGGSGAASVMALWLIGPVLMGALSRPAIQNKEPLTAVQEKQLGGFAFRTWMFFEQFAGPEHNWLPPDNVEEVSGQIVAARTSPTNISMGLLSRLAACDLGFLPAGEVVEGTTRMVATLERLDRHQGHLFNWYDTQSLQTLHPRYVSTVDSGNLLAALVTLRSGLLELANSRPVPWRWRLGIGDMLDVLMEEASAGTGIGNGEGDGRVSDLRALQERIRSTPDTATSACEVLLQARASLGRIREAAPLAASPGYWLDVVDRHLGRILDEMRHLLPWLSDPELVRRAAGDAGGSLAAFLRRWGEASLAELAAGEMQWGLEFDDIIRSSGLGSAAAAELRKSLGTAAERAAERLDRIRQLAARCDELADMDMKFLYDPVVHLFHIGYNVDTRELDPAYYDLLASEARLGSYVAVARGLVPLEHWFHMSRLLAADPGKPVLLSWSGSMFEYLMPGLFLPDFEGTLLGESDRGAVARQIAYGASHSIPWGTSESGYNQMDVRMAYQYRAFGVPGLGLKRGLADDLVVAPYATALALMVAPAEACANLVRLAEEGAVGRFGFYEALDYTPQRVPSGRRMAIVRSHMAHHSGMSLLAFTGVLCSQPMRRRFLADMEMRANELLLQERIPPARTRIGMQMARSPETRAPEEAHELVSRHVETAATPIPEVHLLSNGRYHVMLTNAGGGYSRWQDLALTRWREDPTRDAWGMFFYIRDTVTHDIWSPMHHPTGGRFSRYEVNFMQGTAEYGAERNGIQTVLRVAVSAEDDLELRRLTVTNLSDRLRVLEVTTYAEVVLAPSSAEAAHPVFSGLFVEAETVPEKSAIFFSRRCRTVTENWPCLFHLFLCRGPGVPAPGFETSRERFLGRGRTTARPAAVEAGGLLTPPVGAPLDPVAAIRHRIVLKPGAAVILDAVLGVGATREAAASLVDKHLDSRIAERVFDVAWTHSQILLHQLKASEADAQLYGRLAGSLLYANRRYRASPTLIARNTKGQSALWSYAVSGDRPILLLRISDEASLALVRRLIQAHSYWRHKGLEVELVIWAETYAGYRQSLFDAIVAAVHAGTVAKVLDQPGGIFVRNIDQVAEEDRLLFQAVARIVINDRSGTLETQVDRQRREIPLPAPLRPTRAPERVEPAAANPAPRQLLFSNGIGGFTEDGREYVIVMPPGVTTPAPWANVLANPDGFGSVITERGSSYTWAENAHEFRLTPWSNDPVSDPGGESFYLRDEETGVFWSPTPGPATGRTPYVCRHGLGYTVYEHTERQIATEMQVAVTADAPVKLTIVTVRNLSDRSRRLSVTGVCDWVLGEQRERQAMHVVTRLDPQTGAIFATNASNYDFPGRVAFFHCGEAGRTFTCDRTEFLGRNGDPAHPAAMRREGLSNAVGAGLDPCAAIQAPLIIPPHEERRVTFALGTARNEEEARGLLRRFSGYDGARQALEGVWQFWKHQLGGVYVETPDQSLDFLVNHWLLYQVLAARFWGRSAFYQSGGAYGFRDQLQDSLAFLYEWPGLTRRQVLLCAARQFTKGDAQHWWHPPSGRGVRSRISDTALWLPYVTSCYVAVTGDTGLLDEKVPFLEGRALRPDEESYYDLPRVSDDSATVYEHCVRAIRHSLQFGEHGLPLMGNGDWNDGMNRVGHEGKGESVWLGFFLHSVLNRFADVATRHGDEPFALDCRQKARHLGRAIEAKGWDGEWYRRAYFDDGSPLGSQQNDECRIDVLPQSWAVLSGAGTPEHNALALRSACEHLVDPKLKLVRLFTPPFADGLAQPGYIRGYVPGVRENGGQYTHAGVWLAAALAENGDAAGAWRLASFLNPIRHGDSAEAIGRYRVEPYVMAADIYTAEGHEGRGGWTWYTGSAGWMYQLLVERLLGLRVRVDTLAIEPVWHPEWTEYTVHYRYRNTFYHIRVLKSGPGSGRVVVDGVDQPDNLIHLVDDGRERSVVVEVAAAGEGPGEGKTGCSG
jgi:cellobiose phosphorylase